LLWSSKLFYNGNIKINKSARWKRTGSKNPAGPESSKKSKEVSCTQRKLQLSHKLNLNFLLLCIYLGILISVVLDEYFVLIKASRGWHGAAYILI